MRIHKHMPQNEYVQIDDEQSVFDTMDQMRKLGKETYESNLKFNAILNQKQEVYTLAKVLARELVHDLKDLRNFVKPNEKVVKSPVKHTAPKKRNKKINRATPKRPVKKIKPTSKKPVSSMKKLKANINRAKKSKTQEFNNTTNKIVKKLEI